MEVQQQRNEKEQKNAPDERLIFQQSKKDRRGENVDRSLSSRTGNPFVGVDDKSIGRRSIERDSDASKNRSSVPDAQDRSIKRDFPFLKRCSTVISAYDRSIKRDFDTSNERPTKR